MDYIVRHESSGAFKKLIGERCWCVNICRHRKIKMAALVPIITTRQKNNDALGTAFAAIYQKKGATVVETCRNLIHCVQEPQS